jgi:NAD+ synthase
MKGETLSDMNETLFLDVLKKEMALEPEKLCHHLEAFILDKMEKLDRDGVILGLSGGIDSAVVAALCRRAVGAERTVALLMPEKDSEANHIKDALALAKNLNIEARLIDMTRYLRELDVYDLVPLSKIPFMRRVRGFLNKMGYRIFERRTGETLFSASLAGIRSEKYETILKKRNAYYRIKHRLRMALLYLYGERENRLVVGAANKTEKLIGYFVKHGCDDAADIMPLITLYKTQVRELARYLQIPPHIIAKPPSPDIIPGIDDEDAIGLPYDVLDLILLGFEKEHSVADISGVLKIGTEKVDGVKRLVERSAHMRMIYAPEDL